MLLHRIVLGKYGNAAKDAFGGAGGLYGAGRWHTPGKPIVYLSESLALSMLEILVHTQRSDRLRPYVRWEIEVPDAGIVTHGKLPSGWLKDAAITRKLGDAWLAARSSVALKVPSVIVPQEFNVLLNPLHPDFEYKWVQKGPTAVVFDPRL